MTKLAIFAHYDKHNKIEDYVIEYLKGLKEIVQDIIFVSDSNVKQEELNKITNYISHLINGSHGEYDFGSYKRGFLWAYDNNILKNYDELIFANDSCYAPLYPFQNMFKKMSCKNIDFWGPTMNDNDENLNKLSSNIHIQSFFIVFKPQVFLWEGFREFISNIQKEENKNEIIKKYEIGLSKYLIENNFKCDCYSSISKLYTASHTKKYREMILQENLPFIKRNIILKKEIEHVYPFKIKQIISKTNYNYELIKKDYKHNKAELRKIKELSFLTKLLRKKVIRFSLKKKKITLFERILIQWI